MAFTRLLSRRQVDQTSSNEGKLSQRRPGKFEFGGSVRAGIRGKLLTFTLLGGSPYLSSCEGPPREVGGAADSRQETSSDAAQPEDAAAAADAGGRDAAVASDASTRTDAASAADAGHTPDSGNPIDAGSRDSAPTPDAATRTDAASAADAGHTPDSGNPIDAGHAPDSGHTTDAGTPPDAALPPDAATAAERCQNGNLKEVDIDCDGRVNWVDGCDTPLGTSYADTDGDDVEDYCDNDRGANIFNPQQTDRNNNRLADELEKCWDPSAQNADQDDDGVSPPCDCNDRNRNIHGASFPTTLFSESLSSDVPGAEDQPGDGVDADCNGFGEVVRNNPDGTVVIAGEEDYTCLIGETRTSPNHNDHAPCSAGTETCVDDPVAGRSYYGPAEGVVDRTGDPEICGDGIDNNCNTVSNEGCQCNPGEIEACGHTQGECAPGGTHACGADGRWPSACQNDPVPAAADLCDGFGRDENCNGIADDAYRNRLGLGCRGTGICGVNINSSGSIFDLLADEGRGRFVCDETDQTGTSVTCSVNRGQIEQHPQSLSYDPCTNGVDENCNGEADEDSYVVIDGSTVNGVLVQRSRLRNPDGTAVQCELPSPCGAGNYACAGPGEIACTSAVRGVNATESCTTPGDDNCNGQANEGCQCNPNTDAPRACVTDATVCAPGIAGTQACNTNGRWSQTCTVSATTSNAIAELCGDRIDNNCNGQTDEGFGAVGSQCAGTTACGVDDPRTTQNDGVGTFRCNPNGNTLPPVCSVDLSQSQGGRARPELCDGPGVPLERADQDCNGIPDDNLRTRAAADIGRPGDVCTLPGGCDTGTVVCDGVTNTRCQGDPCNIPDAGIGEEACATQTLKTCVPPPTN